MLRKREFRHKTVVITGAAGGLGRAFSRRFAKAGARLGLLDLKEDAVHNLAVRLTSEGFNCVGLGCDVTDERACQKAIHALVERFGGLDVLINNAGIAQRSAFAQTSTDVFQRVMAVNFFGALYCTKAALPSLISRKGLIIVISSIAGFAPLYGRTAYTASKHALHGLFDTLRTELQKDGVGVLVVCPGFVDTNFSKTALDGDGRITTHPRSKVGQLAAPESVAGAVFSAAIKNKRLLVLSSVGRWTRLLTRVAPGLYERLMTRSLRSELKRETS